MGWVYSDLTHTAKENGGPEEYIRTIHDAGKEEGWNEGYNDGKIDGRKEAAIIGVIVIAVAGTVKLAKFVWNKLKPKKMNPERHVPEEELRKAEEKVAEQMKKQEEEPPVDTGDNQAEKEDDSDDL